MKKTYQRNNDIMLRSVAGEYMLIPTGGESFSDSKLMMLSETGMFLWEKLREPKTIEDLLQESLLEFNGNEAQIKSEICEFINGLMENDLVIGREI